MYRKLTGSSILWFALAILMSGIAYSDMVNEFPLSSSAPPGNNGGEINVVNFGASGSANTYTCTVPAASHVMTCATTTDFKVGQGIAIPTAGPVTPIAAIGSVVAAQLQTTGATHLTYAICTGDPYRGVASSCATSTITNANAAQDVLNPVSLTFTPSTVNASIPLVYKQVGATWYFLGIAIHSPFYDIGYRAPTSEGWPATPVAQNQTLYTTVSMVSSMSLTLMDTTTAAATAVTVEHDDTAAEQAAVATCNGNSVIWPAGTYRTNRTQFFDLNLVSYTTFTASTPNYPNLFSQGQIQVPSNCLLHGPGVIDTEFASGGGEAPFGFNTGQHENPFVMGTRIVYSLNNQAVGADYVVTTTPTDASHFAPGDYVMTYGGSTFGGGDVSNELNIVKSADGSTGVIRLLWALQKPIPFGGPLDVAPAIQLLNGDIVHDVNLRDLTINSYGGVAVNTSAVLNTNWRNLTATKESQAFLWFGGWRRNWQNLDNNFVSVGEEIDSDEDFSFRGGSWLLFGLGVVVDETTATAIFDKTKITLTDQFCASNNCTGGTSNGGAGSLGVSQDVQNVQITNSVITKNCTQSNSNERGADVIGVDGGGIVGGFMSGFMVDGNSIYTNCNKVFNVLGTRANYQMEFRFNNVAQQVASTTGWAGVIRANAGVHILDNELSVNFTGGGITTGAILLDPGPITFEPFWVARNRIGFPAGNNGSCIEVADPGALQSYPVYLTDNQCENATDGVLVDNIADTPNIYISRMNFTNVTTPYSPTGLINGGIRGLNKPTVTTCGTSTVNTGSTNTQGTVTGSGGATACTVVFNTANPWPSQPICNAMDITTASALKVAYSTNLSFTVSNMTASDSFTYTCGGN